jgi:Flp pilus assembly protein TadG/Mg-chelatase subunit ChlD
MSAVKSIIRRFLKEAGGNTALVFGLSALPLMLAVGSAIEFSNLLDSKTKLQAAVDSAALAAAAQYGNGNADYAAVAKQYIEGNKPEGMGKNPLSVNVTLNTQDLSVTVKASGKVETSFGKLLNMSPGSGSAENQSQSDGLDTISSASTVALPIFSQFHKGEIVLVVDYSASMNDYVGSKRKYVSMREEVIKLISELSQNGTNMDVKFGLVPFSEAVRVTMPDKYYYGRTSNSNVTRCIEDRQYPYNTQPTTPTSSNSTKWNYYSSCSNYATYNVTVRPMTTSHAATLAQVNQMRPIGNTHITLGMEIAYHMMTPNEPFTDTVPLGTENTLKAVVLLTDGAQTSGGYGPNNKWGVPQAEANLTTLCNSMKANGIRVVTVSFDLPDNQNAASEQRLANCASGPQYYFNVETNAELSSAFGTIKNQLARNMYIKE